MLYLNYRAKKEFQINFLKKNPFAKKRIDKGIFRLNLKRLDIRLLT